MSSEEPRPAPAENPKRTSTDQVPAVTGRKWPLRVFGVVFLAAIIGLVVWRLAFSAPPEAAAGGGGRRGGDGGGKPVPVTLTTVVKQDVQLTLDGLGAVVPLATVAVKARVDGKLEQVMFKEGQTVKKGDVLAQIDPRPFKIQLDQATSTLARDSAQARNAMLNLERFKGLREQKLVPQQQVDDQQTLVDQAEAVMGIDRAQVDSAKLSLEWARVTSPIDGVTGVRQIDPGNLVRAADATGLVLITQLDPIAVVFTLPQDALPEVSKAMSNGPLTVEAYARDGTTMIASGTLMLIDNQINQTTATIRLKAQFDNTSQTLWPNAFVKARLKLNKRTDLLTIPTPAVQRGPKGTFVYVVAADDTASVRPIELDGTEGTLTLIKSGLEAGERVVLDGQSQLRPGSKVQTGEGRQAADGGEPEAPAKKKWGGGKRAEGAAP
jgi:multidrug efflux system membrane fusion protein